MVLWADLSDLSAANLAVVRSQGGTMNMPQLPNTNPGAPDGAGAKTPKSAVSPSSKKTKQAATPMGAPKTPKGSETAFAKFLREDDSDDE